MLSGSQLSLLKRNAASWAGCFDVAMVLDSNACQHALGLGNYELLIAAGAKKELSSTENGFEQLKTFRETNQDNWMFGWLTYDLKNQTEKLESRHPDGIGFLPLYFFIPEKIIVVHADGTVLTGEEWIDEIIGFNYKEADISLQVPLQAKVSKETYLQTVDTIRTHIEEGDVYELNYCVEFFANNITIDPVAVYEQLRLKSPVPFGCFVKHHHRYIMGASPERFMTKKGNKVYSQPIKGTARRGRTVEEDLLQKQALLNSEKERAENLMIVDLVRNDLAHTSVTGTIEVDELFGIYSFPQVHQMISTVSSTVKETADPVDTIKHAFPMGSMTGAPKIMAMKLIEQYETTKRGLYSGAIGYFTPNGDFDLNVVIRSIQYDEGNRYLNFEVGGAITYDSVAEDEYDECLLKAKAMQDVLAGK